MLALFASWHNSAFCVDGCAGCGAPATPRKTQLAQQLAMHVVAARPTYLSSSNIDALALQQHLELVTQQVCALSLPSLFFWALLLQPTALLRLQSAGLEKPPAVKQKIVEGQMNKWCGANTIMESRVPERLRICRVFAGSRRYAFWISPLLLMTPCQSRCVSFYQETRCFLWFVAVE